ncbi:MAG TPA: APC family permease [Pseudonocardiaceae bacterium]|nr:APC family permease [Pseudonocardiaceae bacterium]
MTATATPTQTPGETQQLKRTLNTPKIVFLIVAAAAPLGAMVATVPLAFAIGSGPGVPAMFVFAGLTLLCFSVGYAAMGRQIVNAGGFYTYLSSGLGKPVAVAGGFVAIIAYNAIAIGVLGAFGYFAQTIAASHGLNLPWELWALAGAVVMGFLGYRQVDLSAKVLMLLMIGEIGVLLALNLAVIVHKGGAALPPVSFSPGVALGAGSGVAMMFAFASFTGFESAALYGEEAKNPKRSVPVATYIAVILISSFYALTSWAAVGGVGVGQVRGTATKQLGNLFFLLSDRYMNPIATDVMQALLCTSLFAAMLALHNAANRYVYVLGREGVLPRWFGVVHRKHASPHRASLVLTIVSVVVAGCFALGGLDPYTGLASSMLGLGTLGIILLQGSAAVSVIAYFRRRPERHWWRTLIAPLLGAAGLTTAVVLLVLNYSLLTGTSTALVNHLPWLYVVLAVAGVGYAHWMRRTHPNRYRNLASVHLRSDTDAPEAVDTADVEAGALAER